MTTQENHKPGLTFVIKWIIAVIVANITSLLLISGVVFATQTLKLPGWLVGSVAALIVGAILGAGQGYVIRHYLDRSEVWIALTTIGYAVGFIVPTLLKLDPLMRYASIGLALGLLQWSILRRYVEASSWWIVVNFACWLVAGLFEGGLLLYSPVSGLVMMWMLNHPKQLMSTSAVTQVN